MAAVTSQLRMTTLHEWHTLRDSENYLRLNLRGVRLGVGLSPAQQVTSETKKYNELLLPSPQPKTGGIWKTKDRIVQVCGRMSNKSEIQPSVLTEGPNGELLTKYHYSVGSIYYSNL